MGAVNAYLIKRLGLTRNGYFPRAFQFDGQSLWTWPDRTTERVSGDPIEVGLWCAMLEEQERGMPGVPAAKPEGE